MTRWPWMTLLVAVVAFASPLGQEVVRGAVLSSEQITQAVSGFLVVMGVLLLTGLALVEWLVRSLIVRRRRTAARMAVLSAPGKAER